jgi:hypothetical protein
MFFALVCFVLAILNKDDTKQATPDPGYGQGDDDAPGPDWTYSDLWANHPLDQPTTKASDAQDQR